MANNNDTHKKAVEYAACYLIENGIPTRAGPGRGVDLILDDGKTILVRGMMGEISIALMHGSIDTLKTNYVIGITNLQYRCIRKIYIMSIDDAKTIAVNKPDKAVGQDDWFIGPQSYRMYQDNTDILKE